MNKVKLKAQELVNSFLRLEDDTTFYWDPLYDRRLLDEEVLDHAIKCSIVTVDEMIEQSKDSDFGGFELFWNAVKTELLNYER